jgi:hypothetical protein
VDLKALPEKPFARGPQRDGQAPAERERNRDFLARSGGDPKKLQGRDEGARPVRPAASTRGDNSMAAKDAGAPWGE